MPDFFKWTHSWIDYWEKQVGYKADHCGATDCGNRKNLVGAHVKKVNSLDQSWYITPLCNDGCNQRTDEFYVDTRLVPVPSNNPNIKY